MKRYISLAIFSLAIAATAAISLPAPTQAAGSISCKAMTWGNAARPVRVLARHAAMNSWKVNAGAAWNTWSLAKARSKRCRKEGKLWNCVAKAKPCRKLGLKG